MIPKIIHYCWFGHNPIPENLKKCIDSWKVMMPNWELKLWDEASFDVNSIAWTAEAYAAKKYAFVSDYVRLVALYEFGGLYLDTDVKLVRSLEPLCREYDSFMGFENMHVLTSAVIAMPAKHPLVKAFLKYYDRRYYSQEIIYQNEANVRMMTDICKKNGLVCDNLEQDIIIGSGVENERKVHIYPQTYFCPYDFYHNKNFSEDTYAIHYFDASWLDKDTKRRILKERSVLYKSILKIKAKIKRMIKG